MEVEAVSVILSINITCMLMTHSCIYPDKEFNFSSSLKNLEHCIADIRLWMTQNLPKLNDNKTIVFSEFRIVQLNS